MSSKVQLIIRSVLLIVVVLLSYNLYEIIQEPIRFEEIKTKRTSAIKTKLEEIRDAQKAFKGEFLYFAKDMDMLVNFVDTGRITIIERKDSSFEYYNEVFQQDMMKDTIVTRVLGYQSAKTAIFTEDFDAQSLKYIPYTDNVPFELDAKRLNRNNIIIPVFEAKATNEVIYADVFKKYKQYIDAEGSLSVGSLTEPTLSGNWK